MTGRAVIFHGPGQPFEITRFPVPEPRGAEVLVRVLCCTLCGSDLHTHAGRRREPTPLVLGHEIVGRIQAFGPDAVRSDLNGNALSIGDRVTWSIAVGCGGCFFCTHELPQKCERLFKYGHQRLVPARPFAGGLADYVLLEPGTAILSLPQSISDVVGATASCATATAAAVLRQGGAQHPEDKAFLILGAGLLGLTACAMARTAGAPLILVCELDEVRRRRALAFGATHAVPPDQIATATAAATEGRGADVAIELAGSADAVAAALSAVRVGGTVVLAGTVLPIAPIPLDPESVVRHMLTIRGVHNYAPADLAAAIDFLAGNGQCFPFASLIGPSFRLDDVEQAFVHAHAHAGSRTVVTP